MAVPIRHANRYKIKWQTGELIVPASKAKIPKTAINQLPSAASDQLIKHGVIPPPLNLIESSDFIVYAVLT